MTYLLTFYTDWFIPEQSAGCARGPVIFIRPQYKDNRGLYKHEMIHVHQWIRTLGIHSFLYLLSDSYKLKCEVEAYKVQLQYCTDIELNTRRFARFIATKYDLDITDEEAYRLLTAD